MKSNHKVLVSVIAGVLVVALAAAAIIYFQTKTNDEGRTQNDTSSEQTPPIEDEQNIDQEPQTQTKQLTVFYVAVGHGGHSGEEIGCGDSLVSAQTGDKTFQDQVKATFDHLLSEKSKDIGQSGLYNSLYQSDLTFDHSKMDGKTLNVYLLGDVKSSGACDNPRIKAQLETTAKAASGAERAVIFVGPRSLDEILDLR